MKRLVQWWLVKRHVRRGPKVCGWIVAICFALLALEFYGAFAYVMWRDVPNFAYNLALWEEETRTREFYTVAEASRQRPSETCPDLMSTPSSVASYLESKRASSLGLVPLCRADLGQDLPRPWCDALKNGAGMRLPRYRDEVKCELPSYSAEFADLEIVTVALGDGSLRLVPWQNGVNEFKENVGEKKAVTARFTFQVAPDDHLIETIWCCSRDSIGNPLMGEYATELQAVEVLLLTIIAAWAVIFVLTVRRIIVVSGRRDPNSPIPWIIEVPLRAAALDHDPFKGLNNALDCYEYEYAEHGARKWLFLVFEMPNSMSDLIARRIAYSIERSLTTVASGGKRVWTTGTRLFS